MAYSCKLAWKEEVRFSYAGQKQAGTMTLPKPGVHECQRGYDEGRSSHVRATGSSGRESARLKGLEARWSS